MYGGSGVSPNPPGTRGPVCLSWKRTVRSPNSPCSNHLGAQVRRRRESCHRSRPLPRAHQATPLRFIRRSARCNRKTSTSAPSALFLRPCRRAGKTRVLFSTRQSPGRRKLANAENRHPKTFAAPARPPACATPRSSASGSWAISSSGQFIIEIGNLQTIILGIESSCDETAAAVVADGSKVLSSVVASQLDVHARYGGVVPELASREHLRAIGPVVREALAASRSRLRRSRRDRGHARPRPGRVAARRRHLCESPLLRPQTAS